MADPNTITSSGELNPDPITGEPGSHPVGTGVGAVAAGAASAAAIGLAAGPVGAVVGAVIGAVSGGLAGKGIAEQIDPTAHELYWQQNHANQPYAANGDYGQYSGAYRTGYEGVNRHGLDKGFSDVEGDLKSTYETTRDKTAVGWEHAKDATRAAYDHARDSVAKD